MDGRVALVTGASRGIGQAIAERFAAEGAAVAATARTLNEGDHKLSGSLAATIEAITSGGGNAVVVQGDLARPEDRARIVETVHEQLGPIDVLVNNAAVTYLEPVATFTDRRFDRMFEVQVRAPFDLAQRVIPDMRELSRGWILNISSPAARHPHGPPYRGLPGFVVYGMVKAALERFTTGLAMELYDDHIAVNSLAPGGLVLTPGVLEHSLDEYVSEEQTEPVESIVEAALRLCTGDPRELTGRVAYSSELLDELGKVLGA
jgi:NAD(P)-dependent dehydrogenase (short-subunit alcohol dehydrogenase family)